MIDAYTVQAKSEKPIAIVLFMGLLVACAMLTWSLSTQLDQTKLAGILIFVLATVALIEPRAAILILFVYLPVMGDVRRIMSYYMASVQFDLLLLVGPIIAGILMLTAKFRGLLTARTPVAWWVTILMFFMGLEIFNPAQGGLSVGLAGGLFYLVPMAWFWIGQAYGTREFLRQVLMYIVVPVGVAAGLLGAWQVMVGFLDYQARWLLTQSNVAVYTEGGARPFSFFVSPTEYACYCAVGCVILVSGLFARKVKPTLIFAPFLLVSCFLVASRGPVLAIFVAIVALWGLRKRGEEATISIPRLVVTAFIAVFALVAALTFLQSTDVGDQVAPLVARQTQGLLNPGQTSASGHAELFYTGILSSFIQPGGLGLGATTLAAGKMGDSSVAAANTEVDISNMFLSLGPAGGIVFVVLIYKVFRLALSYMRRADSHESFAFYGMFFCLPGAWLVGGHYALTTLFWFCVGAVDRLNDDWAKENLVVNDVNQSVGMKTLRSRFVLK